MLIRRLLTLLLFTLAVAIAAWWFLQLRAPAPTIAPATISLPAPPAIDAGTQGRLFGERTLTASNVNVTVKGVLASVTEGGPGMALLAVDEAPPRAYSTGQFVARGTKVLEVRRDRVVLDQGGARVELTVPEPKPVASTGIVRAAPPGAPQAAVQPTAQPAPSTLDRSPPPPPGQQRPRSDRRSGGSVIRQADPE